MAKTRLTQTGFNKLQAELNELKTVKRAEIAEKIKVARGYGDLSENSAYDEAKNEQGLMENRINELEAQLREVEIIPDDEISNDVVSIGTIVDLEDDLGEQMESRLVSSIETSSDDGIETITEKAPVGEAILGHKAGETVVVHAPAGEFEIKILSIRV